VKKTKMPAVMLEDEESVSDEEDVEADGDDAGATFGAQRGAAVSHSCANVENSRLSSRREEDSQRVGLDRWSTTFAVQSGAAVSMCSDADKSHSFKFKEK